MSSGIQIAGEGVSMWTIADEALASSIGVDFGRAPRGGREGKFERAESSRSGEGTAQAFVEMSRKTRSNKLNLAPARGKWVDRGKEIPEKERRRGRRLRKENKHSLLDF